MKESNIKSFRFQKVPLTKTKLDCWKKYFIPYTEYIWFLSHFPPKTILIVMLMESECAPKIKSFKEKSQNVKCQCISNFETRNICLHSFLSVFVVADETESILGLHVYNE